MLQYLARMIRGLQKLRAQASEHDQASTRQAIAQAAAVKAQKLAVIAQEQVTWGSCIISISQTHFTGSGAL